MRWLALILALCAVPALARAGGAGSTGANGLKLSAGARPEGMGGAFTGLADDLSSLFWNPAGLATIKRPMGSLMHTAYLADTSYDVVALAVPLGPLGTLGGAVNMLNYGSYPKVGRGSLSSIGTFSSADTFVLAGYGFGLPPVFGLDRLRAGAVTKLTFQELTAETATGLAFTAGLLWDSPLEGLRIGTLVDNAGTLVGGGDGMLPLSWRVGASYSRGISPWLSGVATADTVIQMDTGFHGGAGLEVVAYRMLSLRGGWRGGGAEGGPTFGLGVGYPLNVLGRELWLRLDYAAATHGIIGTAHRVQLTAAFGSLLAGSMGKVRITGEGTAAVARWTGPGPAYLVEAMPDWDANWRTLTPEPVPGGDVPLSALLPGSYRVRVTVVDPAKPGWRGKSREARFSMPAPDLVLRLAREGMDVRLAWEGGVGPAYDIVAQSADDPEPLRITEEPVTGSSFPLVGVPPGEYTFRVRTVDSSQPAWKGPVSNDARILVEGPSPGIAARELRSLQERLGAVAFRGDPPEVDPASDAVLAAVADIMAWVPDLRVRVEGHSDGAGGAAAALEQSRLRAAAVVRYLVEKKGVAAGRLTSEGFGDTHPVADGGTEEGRAKNRRIEFATVGPGSGR